MPGPGAKPPRKTCRGRRPLPLVLKAAGGRLTTRGCAPYHTRPDHGALLPGMDGLLMAKRQPGRPKTGPRAANLFARLARRKRRPLFLQRFVAEEADKLVHRTPRRARAVEIVTRWADLAAKGHLARKETALDAEFLAEVLGEALAYRTGAESSDQIRARTQ